MAAQKIVTPHAYKKWLKAYREACQGVSDIVATIRAERGSWSIPRREDLLGQWWMARLDRNDLKRRMDCLVVQKGSAWSPAAQERLERAGRLKRDEQ